MTAAVAAGRRGRRSSVCCSAMTCYVLAGLTRDHVPAGDTCHVQYAQPLSVLTIHHAPKNTQRKSR